jgi:hypothetical protein
MEFGLNWETGLIVVTLILLVFLIYMKYVKKDAFASEHCACSQENARDRPGRVAGIGGI